MIEICSKERSKVTLNNIIDFVYVEREVAYSRTMSC